MNTINSGIYNKQPETVLLTSFFGPFWKIGEKTNKEHINKKEPQKGKRRKKETDFK